MPYASGCRDCGNPPEPDRTRCKACAKKRREQETARREERREHGQCLVCGDPVAQTKLLAAGAKRVRQPAVYCKTHLAYYAARARSV